jgi:vitamin B12 transporter
VKPIVSSILILLSVPFAFAQTTRISDQIVVTASELPETVESTPAAVTVITRKDIEERAAREIADVLREVPGLTISRTGSLGKTSSVFMRGASSKQTLALWNGIEINDPYFSGYNWGQLSTAGVEKIEVVRGPFSSLYGADAVGGVINIITSGGRDHALLDLAAGGRGLMNGVLSVVQNSGPSSFHLTAEHRQDNGFALNDNDRRNSLLGGFTYSVSRAWTIGLTGRHANYDLGVPRNTNAFATAYVATPHHREGGKEWQLAIPVTGSIGRVHTELRVSQSRRDDQAEDPDSDSFGITRSKRRNIRATARTATAIGTLVVGADGERSEAENRDSFGLDLDTHRRTSNAIFVEDRISRDLGNGRLEAALGVRRDRYTTFGSETSPRIAAAWSKDGHKLRAAFGEAFRAPQIGELYLPFFGNPELNAEHSRTSEIGYDRFFADAGNLSVTLFHNNFRDLIVYDLAANRFGNIGEARSSGVEVGGGDRRGPLSFSVSYTYLRATEEPSGKQLLRRPKHSGSLALGYDGGPRSAQLVIAHMGRRPDVNDLFPFGTLTNRAHTTADLTLRWSLGSVGPYLKLENLTNTRYEEVLGFPSPKRRAIAGVRYSAAR